MVKTRILTTIGSALLIVAAGSGPMSLAQAGDAQVAPPRMQKATRYDRAALKQAPRATLRGATISEKDTAGLSLAAWQADPRAQNFIYGQC